MNKTGKNTSSRAAILLAAALLFSAVTGGACVKEFETLQPLSLPGLNQSSGNSGTGDNSINSGNFQLLLTDFPLRGKEITKVLTYFKRIDVQSPDGNWTTIANFGEEGQEYDLLTLQNGVTAQLASVDLTPGKYTQIRLILNRSNLLEVNDDSGTYYESLTIPSSGRSGIMLNNPFTIAEDGKVSLTVDFDAQKSIFYIRGIGYLMWPVITVIEN